MFKETAKELLEFIEKSPSCFHAVKTMKDMLNVEGFEEIKEADKWELNEGGKYYVTRNDSSIIAFVMPEKEFSGYRIMASHSDSPTFKIKENPEMQVDKKYVKLNVERYGGMICSPWFDRPLSVAGRIIVKENDEFVTKLVDVDRDLLMLPNLAIHMNREVNDGYKYNAQKDMLPLYGDIASKDTFMKTIAETAGVKEDDILAHDLFLYNRIKGTIWGANEEFVSSSRLDDLQCAFASLKGFLKGEKKAHLAVHCVLDNEEVGSGTKQGAASTFLYDVLVRINECMGYSYENYVRNLAKSFMLSADNAHAVHPNYSDVADPVNRPYLNEGIVIKYSANQKYCTDAVSAAKFKDLCDRAGVKYQTFVNRSDVRGGGTLGSVASTLMPVKTVDIGIPLLAMHSARELMGSVDMDALAGAVKMFFCS